LPRELVSEFLRRYVSNVMEVFHCPGDDTDDSYFKQWGLSYSYYEELGDRRIQQTLFYKVLRSSSKTPVLWDAEGRFHGTIVPKNFLFADGHVDVFLDDEAKKMISRLEQPH
jgi:hypothetical protein